MTMTVQYMDGAHDFHDFLPQNMCTQFLKISLLLLLISFGALCILVA